MYKKRNGATLKVFRAIDIGKAPKTDHELKAKSASTSPAVLFLSGWQPGTQLVKSWFHSAVQVHHHTWVEGDKIAKSLGASCHDFGYYEIPDAWLGLDKIIVDAGSACQALCNNAKVAYEH